MVWPQFPDRSWRFVPARYCHSLPVFIAWEPAWDQPRHLEYRYDSGDLEAPKAYLGRQLTRHSLEEIGGHLGGRDHSTVLHACSKIEDVYKSDSQLRRRIDAVACQLTQSR